MDAFIDMIITQKGALSSSLLRYCTFSGYLEGFQQPFGDNYVG